jgi:hypothetical protein
MAKVWITKAINIISSFRKLCKTSEIRVLILTAALIAALALWRYMKEREKF